MTGDKYDDMGTADLLREVCRKLDRIEKQGAPKVVKVEPDIAPWGVDVDRIARDRATQKHLTYR